MFELSGLKTRPRADSVPPRSSRRLAYAALAAALAAAAPVRATEVETLIRSMVEATKALNYDGLFVYKRDTQMDAMRIIHKNTGMSETERLVSLSGPPREVIRDGSRVTCVFADDKAVMVERRQPRDFFALGLSEPVEHLTAYYAFNLEGTDRVAGRTAQIINIVPKAADRYSYRLWIDKDTNFLLRSVILDRNGHPLEEVQFIQIAINTDIPEQSLSAEVAGGGFTWYTNSDAETDRDMPKDDHDWSVNWLPVGFEMKNNRVQHMSASEMPVKHMVYSDGLAMVSVFVEKLMGSAQPLQGYSSMGAVNAYSRVTDNYQITVVGELPQPTVRQIAASVSFANP